MTITALIAKARQTDLKKDEFETTAAYQQRVAAAGNSMPSGFVPLVLPGTLSSEYDADAGTLKISQYSLPISCGLYDSSLSKEAKAIQFGESSRTSYGVDLGSAYCAEHEVARVEGKPYEASNSYGAKTIVQPVKLTKEGLYFGYGAGSQSLIAGRPRYSSEPAFTFPATATEARSLKANGSLIFLVRPVAPYLVEGSRYYEPKINSPTEITTKSTFLAVQAQCIGVIDRVTGKVFAVAPMRNRL